MTSPARAHILVLDDDEAMLDLARRVLERAGYQVSLAIDAAAARDKVLEQAPDLIVIDYALGGGLTGLDFYRALRAEGFGGPAILVTGFTNEERVMEAMRAGVIDILPKTAGYIDYLPTAVERIMTPIWLRRRLVQTEEAERRESYYKMIADAIPHLVWTASAGAGFEFFSNQWLAFTGVPTHQQLGFAWVDVVVHPDDSVSVRRVITGAMERGERFELVHRLLTTSGDFRWVRSVGAPFLPPGAIAQTWFGTSTDIHEQKIAQDERDGLLESERAARTQAELAVKLKDEFVITLSHELRTPLHAILGWTEILKRDSRDETRRAKALDVIYRNAQLQAQMVSDLLEMSSILSGRMRLDLQRVDLSDIVEQVLSTVEPTAQAKGVRLMSDLEIHDAVSGDPSRLQQMVWNLLVNAIKFTPRDGHVEVRLERAGNELVLSVIDNGKGIAPEFLPHVFDRFRQEDTGIRRESGGLGLGLSIVKQLVELHGGHADVASDGPGHGAVFRLHLPLAPYQLTALAHEAGRQRRIPGAQALAGVRVLVVDDEHDARGLIEQILIDSGAIVELAAGGEQALAQMQQCAPDLVLSDLGMPGMDGYDFIRRLRAQEASSAKERVPAVALTALAGSHDRQNALKAGFQSHIAKPVNSSELIEMCVSLTAGEGS